MKTILVNGKVWLYKQYFAEAVGFDSKSGKINFVGTNEEAIENSPDYDELIDVKGKLILPAFMDGHCHLVKGSLVNKELNLRGAKSKKEFEEKIKEYASGKEGWIQGGYFTEGDFKEDFKVDRDFLDSICPDKPIFISRFDIHSSILNSKAIEESGLENKKNEFGEENLVRDENGRLTGEVKESARTYILSVIPQLSTEEIAGALKDQIKKLHNYGITAVSDITLPEDLDAFEYLLRKEELNLFLDSRLPFKEVANIKDCRERFTTYKNRINFLSLKAFYDGSLTSETAYFHDNYKSRNHSGSRTDFVESGEFYEFAELIDLAGYRMSVHAIGDKAVTDLLELNKRLLDSYGVKDRRFRIEHSQHTRVEDIDKFKEYNVIASVQPWHLFSDAKSAKDKLQHPEETHNYKLMVDKGVTVCFGTDFPVVGENPLENIYYAMTRKTEQMDGSFYPEYNMSLEDCLTCYTINNAYASGLENITGSIREGKKADIIIVDDLFELDAEEIKNVKIDMTFMEGKRLI